MGKRLTANTSATRPINKAKSHQKLHIKISAIHPAGHDASPASQSQACTCIDTPPSEGHRVRYLVEKHFESPVVLFDYPKEIKAFYMKLNEDGKTVAAMDVLFPGIGEIIGGSQREERHGVLVEKMKAMNIDAEEMWWYLDTRKFGSVPHAGFGLGLERLVPFVS